MALIKTNEHEKPSIHVTHLACLHDGEYIGTRHIVGTLYMDMYYCDHCKKDFYNVALPLWQDENGDFYRYREEAVTDAS